LDIPQKIGFEPILQNPPFFTFSEKCRFLKFKVGKMPKKSRVFRFTLKMSVSLQEFHSNLEILDAYRAKFAPTFSGLLGPKKGLKNGKKRPFCTISWGNKGEFGTLFLVQT
jgi:hypothetical protein